MAGTTLPWPARTTVQRGSNGATPVRRWRRVSRGGAMSDRLRVRLLGPLAVTVGGAAIGPEGSHRRALFANLAVRANEVVSVDELVDGLWGDSPPRSATG